MTVPTSSRLVRYFAVLSRWFLIVGAVFALTFTVGRYIIDQLEGKLYAATTIVQELPVGTGDAAAVDLPSHLESIQSPEILTSVINDLGLDHAWARRVFNAKEDELSPADALAYMGKILKVEIKPGTDLITITASSDLPSEAADIANAVAERYKVSRDAEEFQQEARDRVPDSLRQQIEAQQKLVLEKQAALQKLPVSNSPAYVAARTDFDQQQRALGILSAQARQSSSSSPLQESHVRIISRATVPMEPTESHFGALLTVAIVLSILAASFAEVLLLFSRAGERSGNY